MAGMDGTPMPSFESIVQYMGRTEQERQELLWGLIYYVKSLEIRQAHDQPAPPADGTLVAKKAEGDLQQQMLNPHDPGWMPIPSAAIPVSRLWQTDGNGSSTIAVKAVYTKDLIAIRLEWEDPSFDVGSFRVQEFQDAAAVQFSLSEGAGFHGMGTRELPCNLWFWRAEWQMRKDRGLRPDAQEAYFHRASDAEVKTYPAEIQEESRLAGRDAFNPVSLQRILSPVEDLNAKGPGTLTSQLPKEQNVNGRGHSDGRRWRVVFLRSLTTPDAGDIQLEPGKSYPVAFAIWNGSQGDRNGQKMISTWYSLRLE
jgi:DMSO reductase family type II enzyme heme b subunit